MERVSEPIVACELVGFPPEQTSERITEPIVAAELVGIPQEQTSERIPEQIAVSELVGIPHGQTSEQIAVSELVGIPQERNSECTSQGQISERSPELIAVPGLGVVDMNDPHDAEEALRILRRVAARRQAELVEEDVRMSPSSKSTYLRRGSLPVGGLCGCAGRSWLGELGFTRIIRNTRSLITVINCTLNYSSQNHTNPGIRKRGDAIGVSLVVAARWQMQVMISTCCGWM